MAVTWQSKQGIVLSVGDKFIEHGTTPEQIAKAMNDEPGADQGEALDLAILRVGLRMGLLAYGADFLKDNGAPAEIVAQYERDFEEAQAKAAAKQMGLDDWRPLLIKATRTPEQEKVMGDLAGRAAINRFRLFVESNFIYSVDLLVEDMAAALNTDPRGLQAGEDWEKDMSEALSLINRYFYVQHKEIDPAEKAHLSGDEMEELAEMARRLVAYRKKHGGGFFENVAPCFNLEAAAAARPLSYSLTEISKSKEIFLPTGLPWQRQHEISEAGNIGAVLDVSRRGAAPVIISATISDEKGNPFKLDGIRRGAQMAIGNLIQENGGNLPIVVTPEQVYREWACLDSSAVVTRQQAEEMEAAIDSLIKAPARMDFQAQLQQHKRMKKQPDYDYDSPQAGRFSEYLIMAGKVEGVRKDGSRTVAYRVYNYPMLYYHSHIVGHMTSVKRTLITGETVERAAYPTKAEAQGNSRDVAMRHNVLTRIERMKKDERSPRRILLEEIMRDLYIPATRQTERTLLKNLEQYLDELKAQGELKSHAAVMGGRGNRKLIGFSIVL